MTSKYTLPKDYLVGIILPANIKPSYIAFGEEVKVHCDTGEVTGLSENISEDAKQFWKYIEEYIIGK
jgi:hypothetical protein